MNNCQGDHIFRGDQEDQKTCPYKGNVTSFGEPGLKRDPECTETQSKSCRQEHMDCPKMWYVSELHNKKMDKKSSSGCSNGANISYTDCADPCYGNITVIEHKFNDDINADLASSNYSTTDSEDYQDTYEENVSGVPMPLQNENLNCDIDKSNVEKFISQSIKSETSYESELCSDSEVSTSDLPEAVSDISKEEASKQNNACTVHEAEKCVMKYNEIFYNNLVPSVHNLVQSQETVTDLEEKEIFSNYITELQEKLARKRYLCEQNRTTTIPDASYFTKLDTSVKKNTAFVRKVKNFTSIQIETLLKDVSSLNMTKYLGEVAAAIVQAKFKISDIMPAIELCKLLHQTYREFSSYLLTNYQHYFLLKDTDQMLNERKINVDLKFFTDLMKVGILNHTEAFSIITNTLTSAMNMDKEEHANINIILSFYRYCKEGYAIPRKMRNSAQKFDIRLPHFSLLSETQSLTIKNLLRSYYMSLLKHAEKVHHDVQICALKNKKILQFRGELGVERKEKWDTLKFLNDRLLLGIQDLGQELGEEMPDFVLNSCNENALSIIGSNNSDEQELLPDIWENEEEQCFYESFPDIKELLLTSISNSPCKREPSTKTNMKEDKLNTEDEDSENDLDMGNNLNETDEVVPCSNKNGNRDEMDTFLSILQNCMNCSTIDNLAVDFTMNLNKKYNRKRLVKVLVNVSQIKPNILPFYARLVAVLHPVIPDIGSELCHLLKRKFKFHIRKKNQLNIESKLKVVSYIGELVKFKMYSRSEALQCLKLLLHEFSHHNIEMCCTFLEICGRFLFRHNDSHKQTKFFLEQMMRKKTVTALESRYVIMIENAFYYVDPPDQVPFEKEDHPPMHQFIEKLLHQDLARSNTEYILELLSKIDWENSEIAVFATECLTTAHKVKYNNIGYLASIVSGLTYEKEVELVGILVVDGVLEDIRLGMEVNLSKYNQRRLAMMKYLGELYNYHMVKSNDIFDVLYSLISFGVTYDHAHPYCLDPPDHLFRIRLCCVLLETCGQYFNSASSIRRLDYYLTYFQRYFLFKYEDKYWNIIENPFPAGIHYLFEDTLLKLRPGINLFTSLHEATQAVHQIQMNLKTSLPDSTSFSSVDDDLTVQKSELETIKEENNHVLTDDNSVESFTNLEGKQHSSVDDNDHYVISKKYDHGTKLSDLYNAQQHINNRNCNLVSIVHNKEVDDTDFMLEFDRMVSDNICKRKKEAVKPHNIEIPIPFHLWSNRPTKKTYENLQLERTASPRSSIAPAVSFILLMKKGHKQHYKCLTVPIDCDLAIKLKNGEEAEKAEKEYMKQLTLDMNERLQEEDYQEILSG